MPTTTQKKSGTVRPKVRKTGSRYVDSAIGFELKLAGMTRQEWLKSLIEAQADFARKVTNSYKTRTKHQHK